MNVTWRNSLRKLVCWGLIGTQTLKIIFLVHVGKVFKQLIKNPKCFKDLKISGISGFWF